MIKQGNNNVKQGNNKNTNTQVIIKMLIRVSIKC